MNYIYNNTFCNNYILFIIILIFIFYIITQNKTYNIIPSCDIERFNVLNCSDQTNCYLNYQGIPINNNIYTLIGAFNDNSPINKTIPLLVSNSSSITDATMLPNAINIASSFGAPVFGLQNNGSLYLGYDINRAISLGTTKCSNFGGCSCINQVYVASTNYKYAYVGAYTDNSSRMIPILVAFPPPLSKYSSINFKSDFNTQVLPAAMYTANLYGATVFGFQSGGKLYVGYDINKAKSLGSAKCSSNVGCNWTNQVYSAIPYTGCN
jgi:hypothetical protein